VNELVREMLILLRRDANRYSIGIRTDLATELPKVSADRVHRASAAGLDESASSRHRVRYRATNAHSSPLTSLGYLVGYCFSISLSMLMEKTKYAPTICSTGIKVNNRL